MTQILRIHLSKQFLPVYLLGILAAFSAGQLMADIQKGAAVYKTYCAACHGPEGAGLVGPNLTDKQILHGEKKEDIIKVITHGVPGKAMPPWGAILNQSQISDAADFVKSIMGKNLPSPFKQNESSVTPFPKGDLARPLLIRTFMPKMGVKDDVFKHHYRGFESPTYDRNKGLHHPTKQYKLLDGIPGAITVNFGSKLSYCFDSTECRLLYTWHGDYLDFTQYWGKGTGAGRKKFGYLPKIMGKMGFVAQGSAPIPGKPKFKGYRKERSVPVYLFSIDAVNVELKIIPGNKPGVTECEYKLTNTKDGITLHFPESGKVSFASDKGKLAGGKLVLSASEAKAFTVTITPAN